MDLHLGGMSGMIPHKLNTFTFCEMFEKSRRGEGVKGMDKWRADHSSVCTNKDQVVKTTICKYVTRP